MGRRYPSMAKKRVSKSSGSKKAASRPVKGEMAGVKHKGSGRQTKAVVGLILNVFVWPGIGTMVGAATRQETKTGIVQAILFLVSLPLMLIIVGVFLALAVWVWALISSIMQIKEAY